MTIILSSFSSSSSSSSSSLLLQQNAEQDIVPPAIYAKEERLKLFSVSTATYQGTRASSFWEGVFSIDFWKWITYIPKEEETPSMINGNSTESECFPYWWCAYAHPVSERSDCWTGFDPRITIVGQLHQDRPKPASSLAPSKLFNFSF